MSELILIAGPCVVETEEITMQIASRLKELEQKYPVSLIFKASYRKANRTMGTSFRGIGDGKALRILQKVRDEFDLRVTTDIHSWVEADCAAEYVDIIQIPALLCRQTDILEAAAQTGKDINIKKGQFATAEMMLYAVNKVMAISPVGMMLTERGNSFGYSNIVIDMLNIRRLQDMLVPVLVDITHTNGGHYIQSFALGRAAVAAGADGIFLETHPDPNNALSDGKNMIPLAELESLLIQLVRIKEVVG